MYDLQNLYSNLIGLSKSVSTKERILHLVESLRKSLESTKINGKNPSSLRSAYLNFSLFRKLLKEHLSNEKNRKTLSENIFEKVRLSSDEKEKLASVNENRSDYLHSTSANYFRKQFQLKEFREWKLTELFELSKALQDSIYELPELKLEAPNSNDAIQAYLDSVTKNL